MSAGWRVSLRSHVKDSRMLPLEVVSQSVRENSVQITAVVQIRFDQTTAAEGDYSKSRDGPPNM